MRSIHGNLKQRREYRRSLRVESLETRNLLTMTIGGGTLTNTGILTLSEHHAPAGTDHVISATPGVPVTISVDNFGFTDPEDTPPDNFTQVKIASLPNSGSLELAGAAVVAGQCINTTDIAAGNLKFVPSSEAGAPVHPRFTFQVMDDGNGILIGSGNIDLSPNTMIISFAPNTAPIAHDDAYTVKRGESLDEELVGTRLIMNSNGGTNYYDSTDYNITASRNDHNGVTISAQLRPNGNIIIVSGPYASFASGDGSALAPGSYQNTSHNFIAGLPMLNFGWSGGVVIAGNHLTGQFTVNQVQYDNSGNVLSFDASYEDTDNLYFLSDGNRTTSGRVQYNIAQPGSVSLLANDTDAESDPLTAVLVAGPQHGTLKLFSDGGFYYTPEAGFTGTDTFQYKVSDGIAESNVATVSIDVYSLHHAPVGTSSTVSVPAGPSYALKAADFGFTDPNDTTADAFSAVKITTLPTGATLTLSGTPVAAGDFVSVDDIAAGNLVLSPATGNPHISFTFQVQDSGDTSHNGENIDPTPKTLTFNSPPVAQDDHYTVLENDFLDQAFLGNHLRITTSTPVYGSPTLFTNTSDYDGSGGRCTVTQDGNALTFNYPSNESYGAIFGNLFVTFAAPAGAQLVPGEYTDAKLSPNADNPCLNFNGWVYSFEVTGRFTVNEAVYDNAGKILRFDATFEQHSLTTNNRWTGRLQYNASAVLGTSILQNDSDPDGDPITMTSLSTVNTSLASTSLASGTLTIGSNTSGTITIGGWPPYYTNPALVTLPQHGKVVLYQDGGFIYTPDHDYYGTDSFQYRINDGTAQSIGTVSLDVVHVSQAPSGTSGVAKMTVGEAYIVKPEDFGFNDLDDTPSDAFMRVLFTTIPASGSLTLDGVAVAAGDYVAIEDIAAGKLAFTSDPGLPHPVCTFQVEDSGTTDNGGAILDPLPKTLTFDYPPTAADDSFVVNENGYIATTKYGTVPLNGSDSDGDPLTATLVTNPQHGTVYLSPDGSYAYIPDSYFVGSDSFQYKLNDGLADSNVATVSLTVNHVSQPPSGTWNTIDIPADSPYVIKADDFGFLDNYDSPPDTFTGVVITTLPGRGNLKLAGEPVTAGQFVSIEDVAAGNLTFTHGEPNAGWDDSFAFQVQDSGSLDGGGTVLDPYPKTLAFNCIPVACDDAYSVIENGVLDQSKYIDRLTMSSEPGDWIGNGQQYNFDNYSGNFYIANGTDYSGHKYIAISYWSGWENWGLSFYSNSNADLVPGVYTPDNSQISISGDSRGSNSTSGQFTILHVVYAPTGEVLEFEATFEQHAEGAAAGLTGHIQYHLPMPAVSVSFLQNDADADADALTPVLVAAPQHGTLSMDAQGYFRYTPDHGFYGTDTFQYKINDGRIDSNVATVSIDILRKSGAPSGTSSTINIPAAAPRVLQAADFGFTDPNDSPADNFTGVQIDTLPQSGTLLLDGVAVEAGQFVSAADIVAGKLTFTPPTSATGNGHGSFTFQVQDDGSTDNGGANLDPDPKTMKFNVVPIAVNDFFTVNANSILAANHADNVLDVMKNDWDIEGDPLLGFAGTLPAPAHGTVIIDANGKLHYTPNAGFFGTDTFQYAIQDGEGSVSNYATVTVKVAWPIDVTINQAKNQSDITTVSPIHFTVVFSQPVLDFTTDALILATTGQGTLTATITAVGNDGKTYDVAVNGMTGDGTVTAKIAAGEVHNADGIINAASSSIDNSVDYLANGTTLVGTSGDDLIEFHVGSGRAAWTLVVNGKPQSIPANVTSLTLDGLAGNDTLRFFGGADALNADLWYDHGTIHFGSFIVAYANMESAALSGASGKDVATLHDSTGTDAFQAGQGFAKMTSGGKSLATDNFKSVTAQSTQGGDTATFYDSPAGGSTFTVGTSDAKFVNPAFDNHATGFSHVQAYATPGKHSSAVLTGSKDSDRFIASYIGAHLSGYIFSSPVQSAIVGEATPLIPIGRPYDYWVGSFDSVQAIGGGGEDRAVIYGAPGSNTVLNATPTEVVETEPGLTNKVTGFAKVEAYCDGGGENHATLTGTSGAEHLIASPLGVDLIGKNYEISVWSYRHVGVNGGSEDSVDLYTSGNGDTFAVVGKNATLTSGYLSATLTGGNIERNLTGFGHVTAHGTTADTATFHVIASQASAFSAAPSQASMTGDGYQNVAIGFGNTQAYGNGSEINTVAFEDSSGDDFFIASPIGTQMLGAKYNNSAWNFKNISAQSSGGFDTARFYASVSGAESFTATPTDAKYAGKNFTREAKQFSLVESYATPYVGSTAQLTGSTGDDHLVTSPEGAQLWGNGYRIEAWRYSSVTTDGNGGSDIADFYSAPANNRLTAESTFVELTNDIFHNRAVNFANLRIHGSTTGFDSAVLDRALVEIGQKDQPSDTSHNIIRKMWLYDYDAVSTTKKPDDAVLHPQTVDKVLTAFMFD